MENVNGLPVIDVVKQDQRQGDAHSQRQKMKQHFCGNVDGIAVRRG